MSDLVCGGAVPYDKCQEGGDLFFLHHDQVCCVEFDRKDINMNKLVATSLEGKFHVFDMRTQHVTKGFASVSEKVIDLGGDSQTDVWLQCMGNMSKRVLSLLLLFVLLFIWFKMKGVHMCVGPFLQLEMFRVVFI